MSSRTLDQDSHISYLRDSVQETNVINDHLQQKVSTLETQVNSLTQQREELRYAETIAKNELSETRQQYASETMISKQLFEALEEETNMFEEILIQTKSKYTTVYQNLDDIRQDIEIAQATLDQRNIDVEELQNELLNTLGEKTSLEKQCLTARTKGNISARDKIAPFRWTERTFYTDT